MSESRWAKYTKRAGSDALGFSSFLNEAKDQPGANPTGTGIETPGEKAARLGLQSDGHGSYIDPQTGKIVARTINGELVFYDNGPTGGATSDGEGGGDNLETGGGAPAPTYRDPDTGMFTVPPAKPESPEELAAVPDPTPATAPAGMTDHLDKKKKVAQRKAERSSRLSKALQLDGPEEDPMDSVEGRRKAVDDAIAAGRDPATAHELVHGHDSMDADSNASLAASLARITKTGGPAKIKTDKDSNSLLAQDKEENENPQKEGEPSLDDLLGDIRNDEPKPKKKGKTLKSFKKDAADDLEKVDSLLSDNVSEDAIDLAADHSDVISTINESLDARDAKREEIMQQLLESYEQEDAQLSAPLKKTRDQIDNLVANIPDTATKKNLRNKFVGIAAIAATFPKSKVRSGGGARSIVKEDMELLMNEENRKRNIEGFGDGSWDQVHKYGDSMKVLKDAMSDQEWDVVAKEWFDSQPKEVKDRFDGAGNLGGKGTNNHFAGYDKDGNVLKGKGSNSARKYALAKTFLQQAGLDGYTGLPLRFEHMEPDHIRGFSSKIGGKEPTEEDRFNADHPDNWIWSSIGVNNIKSDLDMEGFYNALDKGKEGLSTRDLLFQDEGIRYLADDTTDFAKSFVKSYKAKDGNTYNIMSDSLTSEMIDAREKQQLDLISELQKNGAAVKESRLLKDVFAAGGAIPKQYRMNLSSQNKETVRERSQVKLGDKAIREMFSVMAGKPAEEQAQIQKAWMESWKESLDTIDRNFKSYDAGEDYDSDELIFQPNKDDSGRDVIRGGPTLKKMFKNAMLKKLPGEVGERIAKQIQFRESISFSDKEVETLTEGA